MKSQKSCKNMNSPQKLKIEDGRTSLNQSTNGRKGNAQDVSMQKSIMMTPNKSSSAKKTRDSPFDITDAEMNKIRNTGLNEKSI